MYTALIIYLKRIWNILLFVHRVLIHMSIIWIYVMSCVQLFGWPSCMEKNFDIGFYLQTFQPIFFIPTMLIGTIDFYHFMPLSLTLTLPRVTRSAQSKTCWLHFLAHLIFTDWFLGVMIETIVYFERMLNMLSFMRTIIFYFKEC